MMRKNLFQCLLHEELFCHFKTFQVGITAWGIGCGQSGVPGAYASISSSLCFIDWAIKCKEQSFYQDYIDIKVYIN